MEKLYHEALLDLYRHPLNKTRLDNFNAMQTEHNPLCGETVEIFIQSSPGGQVADIGWQGDGCALSQAGASVATEQCKQKSAGEIKNLSTDTILNLLGLANLNPSRQRCVGLALAAIKNALAT